MRPFDHYYVEEALERLKSIPPDAGPRWGTLTRDALYGHLTNSVRYSMCRAGEPVHGGTFMTRKIIGPFVLHGILRIPKNVKAPDTMAPCYGDLETLHAVLEDYLNLVQADELTPWPHPVFGDIGVDGWARMHMLHFEHHLRQFGA